MSSNPSGPTTRGGRKGRLFSPREESPIILFGLELDSIELLEALTLGSGVIQESPCSCLQQGEVEQEDPRQKLAGEPTGPDLATISRLAA
eukprot:7449568-Pyramimonas_sp.AAC.1